MPLGRQRLLQRFLSAPLYSDGARKTEEDANATAKTAIVPHDKRRERRQTSAGIGERQSNGPIANGDAFDHEERFGGQNGRHLQNREAEVPDKRRPRPPQAPQRLPRILRGHFSTPRDALLRKRDAASIDLPCK